MVGKDGHLVHTRRAAPAFLGKRQVGADDQDDNILAQGSRFLVEAAGFAVTNICFQGKDCCNDADFACCVRQPIKWRPVESSGR